MARLTEQISEAEAAFQAAKAERNAAQDMRKEAWRKETELKDAVSKATAEFDCAFQVGVRSTSLGCLLHCRCAGRKILKRAVVGIGKGLAVRVLAWSAHLLSRQYRPALTVSTAGIDTALTDEYVLMNM